MVGKPATALQKTHCCICSKVIFPQIPVIEYRPTAENGSIEKWFYCPRCWKELKRLRLINMDGRSLIPALDCSEGRGRTRIRWNIASSL
jgi:hypothetical protein